MMVHRLARTLGGLILALGALAACDRLQGMTDRLPDCPLCRLEICTTCAFGHRETFTATADYGLLVFGLTIVDPALTAEPVSGLIDWRVETAPETPVDQRSIDLPGGLVPGQRMVVVWRVPPGTWSFRQAQWRQGKHSVATPPFGGRSLATQVNAGEVTYAGEMTIEATQVTVGGDISLGRAALVDYPGIGVAPQFRPLGDIRTRKSGGAHHNAGDSSKTTK